MIPWRDPEEELGEYVLTGIERLEQYLASWAKLEEDHPTLDTDDDRV